MKARKTTGYRKSLAILAVAAIASHSGASLGADSAGEPGRDATGKNPLKNVYFGEEHMHTRNSFDAFTIGVNQTWEQAYDYAKGKEVKLSTTGQPM